MFKIIKGFYLIGFLTIYSIPVIAQETKGFGLGFVLGEPTGLSAKYHFNRELAVDATVAYSFQDYFHLSSNFLWHFPGFVSPLAEELRPLIGYLGVGPGIRISSSEKPKDGDKRSHFYARFPFGTEWRFQKPKLGAFLEVAPGVALAPETFAIFHGGLGLRFYF